MVRKWILRLLCLFSIVINLVFLIKLFNNSGNLPLRQEEIDAKLKTIQDKSIIPDNQGRKDKQPSLEYEKLRRRLEMGVEEMWYFVSNQVKQLQKKTNTSPQIATHLSKILEEGIEHKRSLLKDVQRLPDLDGYSNWRLKEAYELSDLVQRRLAYLQNPSDCDNAKKLVCEYVKYCGYGCQLHRVVYCLMVAYSTERTLIFQSKGWEYNRNGWEQIFLPVSETCTDVKSIITPWPGNPNSQAVLLGFVDNVSPRPPYVLPPAVPKDLAERIERLHGNPSAWWVGQFLKYLQRLQPGTMDMLEKAAVGLKFQRPIVGIHIRRTDKLDQHEAAFHHVDEYMMHVEEYYKQLSLSQPVPVKRVYLASDDYTVISDLKLKYPEYEVIGDPEVAKTAANNRYSVNSLNGIIRDTYFLSHSDFLVCTLSSNFCRLAYEIMQTLQYPDAASKFKSLDVIYHYGRYGIIRKTAIMDHRANSPDQMDLEIGDIVGVTVGLGIKTTGNHWDGYSKGTNQRTNKEALYPSFKVEDVVEVADLPTYTEVPLKVPEQNQTYLFK